jgi:hypothetical protein
MVRFIALLASLCCAFPLPAMTAPDVECTRAGLEAKADAYVHALEEGDASLMPLAAEARYIENRKEISFDRGVWLEPVKVDFYRSIFDVETCQTFSEVISASGSSPYVIGTRLKVDRDAVSEVEALVTNEDDWLFNAGNYLKYSSREKWPVLPAGQRSDRKTLIEVANAYFDVFKDFSTAGKVPWNIPCARLEGGMYTNPDEKPSNSCTEGPPLEGSVEITNRRFIVDVDMGTVVGLANFGDEKNGWPDSHMFRLENGKVRYVHTMTVCPNGCQLPSPKK